MNRRQVQTEVEQLDAGPHGQSQWYQGCGQKNGDQPDAKAAPLHEPRRMGLRMSLSRSGPASSVQRCCPDRGGWLNKSIRRVRLTPESPNKVDVSFGSTDRISSRTHNNWLRLM